MGLNSPVCGYMCVSAFNIKHPLPWLKHCKKMVKLRLNSELFIFHWCSSTFASLQPWPADGCSHVCHSFFGYNMFSLLSRDCIQSCITVDMRQPFWWCINRQFYIMYWSRSPLSSFHQRRWMKMLIADGRWWTSLERLDAQICLSGLSFILIRLWSRAS